MLGRINQPKNKLYSEDYTQPRTQPVQPSLATGMAGGAPLGQKSVNPMPAQQQPVVPGRMGFDDFEKALGYSLSQPGYIGSGPMNAIAKFGGNPGAFQKTQVMVEGATESGNYGYMTGGSQLDPAFLKQLREGGYGFEIDRSGRHPEARMYDAQGNLLGRQFSVGDTGSKFDNFMEKAVPVGLGVLAGGALGGFIPGVPGIPGVMTGAGAGAGGGGAAAGAGAADIGALGLAEGVYGAGGALGAGAAPGTVGGLAGSTAGFGGLGSVLPSSAGFGGAGALAGAGGFDLSTVGGADPAGVVPSATPAPGNGAFLGEGVQSGIPAWDASVGMGTAATTGGVGSQIAGALQSAGSSVLDFAKKNPQLAALGASGLAQLAGGSPDLPKAPGSGGGAGGVNTPLAGALEQQINGMGAPDYSGVFGLKNTAGDPNTLNQEAIDAAYSQQTRMLDPQFAREKQAMEARLAEQGFVPGTPGYERAMSIFGEERTKAYGSARDSSIMQGYQIGQGDFRNRLSDTELNNSASRESLAQILAKRNQPFNELASIKGNQQIDYNNQLDRYNAEVSSSNSRNQALSQLALALGMYLG